MKIRIDFCNLRQSYGSDGIIYPDTRQSAVNNVEEEEHKTGDAVVRDLTILLSQVSHLLGTPSLPPRGIKNIKATYCVI